MPSASRRERERIFLPQLVAIWQAIEQATGYQWQCTSYWRDSPSHSRGEALDIAPKIAPHAESQYAVHRGSDPVLYKRTSIVRALQQLALQPPFALRFSVGLYIEPDHIHIQLMADPPPFVIKVMKWKQAKPVYTDTRQRMALPMTDGVNPIS